MADGCSSRAVRVGTAGWSIPAALRAAFPAEGSQLERYAARLDAVEINSSFYRPHRHATYARWAASVPDGFRFAVKLPKAITHEARLAAGEDRLRRFADEIAGLGDKRGPVLIQLPPSLGFDGGVAGAFLALAGSVLGGAMVCEPRHAGWFTTEADAVLAAYGVARVAADPPPVPATAAASSGGSAALRYARLHGSPRLYWSDYDAPAIARHAVTMRGGAVERWTIYDNTAAGFALANALDLKRRLADLSCQAL